MEFEYVIIAINKLKIIKDYANGNLAEPTKEIIDIANSFDLTYTIEDFDGVGLFYKNIIKLKDDIILIIANEMNLLDNTTFMYWKIYRDLKFYVPHIEINTPNLTETEKIHNVKYIKQLIMSEENKLLTQKSFDAGYKICGLYLSYYIKNKKERLEYCENLLYELTNECDVLEVKNYISKMKKLSNL